MTELKPCARAALALTFLAAAFFVMPSPSHAINWGKKKGGHARVELPQSAEDEPGTTSFKNTVVAGVDKNAGVDSGETNRRQKDQTPSTGELPGQGKTPTPAVPPTPPPASREKNAPSKPQEKKPFFAPKTELEKRQEQLDQAQKDFDRKKYKKALEESCELVSELRELGYDKYGSDGKGKDAPEYKKLISQALALAEKSGERFDEPSIPSGLNGKTLYFMF